MGQSWNCTSHSGGGMGMTNTATWTVAGRSGGVSTVNVTSTMQSDSAASMSMGQMTIHYDLKGTSTGTLEIEDATGWIIRSKMETDMSGTATMEGSPMGVMDIPMQSKIIATVEPVTGG